MPKEVDKKPIKDCRYFPRSEYYTRFAGTTAFHMQNPEYFGSYHRSERTRFFTKAGGRRNVEFISPVAKKPTKFNSFYAHTGGIASPFSQEYYRDGIKMDKRAPIRTTNAHDALLLYKGKMANIVVESFAEECDNTQKVSKSGPKKYRPIVFVENDYPCVMIQFPAINPLETLTGKIWAQNPKPLQKLLIASFIAYLNTEAMKASIPIEMVLRASFGHNLPSICETDDTFRINVGVIPKKYAKLIGKTLFKLNNELEKIEEDPSVLAELDIDEDLRIYNANKLKAAIDNHVCYKALKNTRDYKKASKSDQAFEKLYQDFCEINQGRGRKGGSSFVPVYLEGETVWDLISERANTRGDTLLREFFHENKTVDWFANTVMEGLAQKNKSPIEYALYKLSRLLKYEDTVSLNYVKINKDLAKQKRIFENTSFKEIYKKDKEFSKIVDILFAAFDANRPDRFIYAELEYAGYEFFSHAKGSSVVKKTCDYGSSSEFSEDITFSELEDEDEFTTTESDTDSTRESEDEVIIQHISHAKLRICSGMKAIMLAQYGALFYLNTQKQKFYSKDIEQMYYEVETALKVVNYTGLTERINWKGIKSILQYDLNHCNASNSGANISLSAKLTICRPAVVILDYTSSTYSEVDKAIKECFSCSDVEIVMMIQSGLKNEQGGADFNPYGELRVFAPNRKTCDSIIDHMKKGLSPQDRLYSETHELVRACKRVGLAMSFYGHRKTNRARFQEITASNGVGLKPGLG